MLTPATPAFDEVKSGDRPSDVWVTDAKGVLLETIRTGHQKRSLSWTPLAQVSPAFVSQLIEAEDKRFYQHVGVDVWSLGKVMFEAIRFQKIRGASTLSMQLVSLLNSSAGSFAIVKKMKQILGAFQLERSWSKEEILEAYLNLVPLRGELVGLRVASLGYFHKQPIGLNEEESALLVAMIRAPNAKTEQVARRACDLLKQKSCEGINAMVEQVLGRPYRLRRDRETLPVLSNRIVGSQSDSHVIVTTLDHRIQKIAIKYLQEQLRELKKNNVNDGAVLIQETQTGRTVAYVANGGPKFSSAAQVDGIQASRQAGSTLKPILYAAALEKRVIQPNSLLKDSPEDLSVGFGRVYHPRNYDNRFRGLVTAGEALGSSLNVPAVRLLGLVGDSEMVKTLSALGISNMRDEEFYGPSLALGTLDLTLWDLTSAYRGLATRQDLFSSETREQLFMMLSSNENRRFTFGLQSLFTLPFLTAVKTGTSKDMRDNWCVGWTPQYTVGVWVGNFDGEPMWNVSGISGAAPIWVQLMKELHSTSEGQLVQHMDPAEALPFQTISRIRYPAKDMFVGLDPDIPEKLQQLPIEIESPQKGHQVFLNGNFLSQSEDTIFWPIQKRGKFQVELKDVQGKVVDEVQFTVR